MMCLLLKYHEELGDCQKSPSIFIGGMGVFGFLCSVGVQQIQDLFLAYFET